MVAGLKGVKETGIKSQEGLKKQVGNERDVEKKMVRISKTYRREDR